MFSVGIAIVGFLLSLSNVLLEILEILPPEFFMWLDLDVTVAMAIIGGINAVLRALPQEGDESVPGEDRENRIHRGGTYIPKQGENNHSGTSLRK